MSFIPLKLVQSRAIFVKERLRVGSTIDTVNIVISVPSNSSA